MPVARLTATPRNGGLLIVAGHAIYEGGKWYGGFEGEDRFYEEHVLDGLRIARSEGYQALALSGGHTRDRESSFPSHSVKNSEGEGMAEFLLTRGLLRARPPAILVESHARDSFENVFFSMLCFFREFSQWPSRVGIVSWKFKAVRFYLIACGLKLGDGRFFFYGSGDPVSESTMRTVAAANSKYDAAIVRVAGKPEIIDPLHRDDKEFGTKRIGRMRPEIATNDEYLRQVKAAYDQRFEEAASSQGVVGHLIDAVERLQPGLGWESITWPWQFAE